MSDMSNDPRWFSTRTKVEDELSAKQSIFCICGRLATGLHETRCRKFRNMVNRETEKRLNSNPAPEAGEPVTGVQDGTND